MKLEKLIAQEIALLLIDTNKNSLSMKEYAMNEYGRIKKKCISIYYESTFICT